MVKRLEDQAGILEVLWVWETNIESGSAKEKGLWLTLGFLVSVLEW